MQIPFYRNNHKLDQQYITQVHYSTVVYIVPLFVHACMHMHAHAHARTCTRAHVWGGIPIIISNSRYPFITVYFWNSLDWTMVTAVPQKVSLEMIWTSLLEMKKVTCNKNLKTALENVDNIVLCFLALAWNCGKSHRLHLKWQHLKSGFVTGD